MKKNNHKAIQTVDFYEVQPVLYKRHQRRKSLLSKCLLTLFLLVLACCAVMITAILCRHFASLEHASRSPLASIVSSASENDAGFPQEENWTLILVNHEHPLPDNYSFEPVTLDNGEQVDSRIYPSLQKMFDDMRADGVYPMVASGFRTAQKQGEIMQQKVEAYRAQGYSEASARALAQEWVAAPGTSEHQTGLAVDINGDGVNSTSDEVYDWLVEHAHEYGFINRYPEGKSDITGIINEPWHYRYVGLSDAAQIKQSGLCLEEYLSQE